MCLGCVEKLDVIKVHFAGFWTAVIVERSVYLDKTVKIQETT